MENIRYNKSLRSSAISHPTFPRRPGRIGNRTYIKKTHPQVCLLLNQRLPITRRCGFSIAATQLGKSYAPMKVMCGLHASLRSSAVSHPTFPRQPGRIGNHTYKKDTPSGVSFA